MAQYTISADDHGVRLDRFIRKKYRNVALTGIFRLIRKGRVRVNGGRKKPAYRLLEHDIIDVYINVPPRQPKSLLVLSAIQKKLAVAALVYTDENIAICNKPQGMPMHAGSGYAWGFVEIMQAYTGNSGFTFVNRIDKATSGLVLGAKNRKTAQRLSELIRKRRVDKYYQAVVQGLVDEECFTLSSFLKKEETRVVEYSHGDNGAREAISEFRVVKRDAARQRTLLAARLITGRTHQLRVQLANRNHPIIGDTRYGEVRAKHMLLCSQRLVIAELDLDVEIPLPDFFPVF